MKLTVTLFTTLVAAIFFSACFKKPATPAISDNHFSCTIDAKGKTYDVVIDFPYSDWNGYGCCYALKGEYFYIRAETKDNSHKFDIGIKVSDPLIGSHEANKKVLWGYPTLNGTYSTIDTLPASITISNFNGDLTAGAKEGDIVEGTFDFSMINPENEKLRVRNGKFRMSRML